MVLSFSAVYAVVATVTRFMVLEAHFGAPERVCRKDRENLDSSNSRAHKGLKIY
jgi:hypothetical protein